MELNKYKTNIYTDFTIFSFHRPTTHSHLKSTPCTGSFKTALSLEKHYHTCLPCQRWGAVARKNSGDNRRDCSPSAPSIRFSALSHSLFVLQSSVCLYSFAFALSHSLFVGERACPSRCNKPCHSHSHLKRISILRSAPPHLPPLSKVRCCRPKKFGRLPKGLFPIRTIN